MTDRKNLLFTLAALGSVLLASSQGPALAAPLVTGTAVQTINTNYAGNPNWFNNAPINYDSPDGSDIVYLGTDTPQPGINYINNLLVCDGEVDEMATASWAQLSSPAGFSGINLFGMQLLGNTWTAVNKFSTSNSTRTGWSQEPVGCAFNPINGHMYVSDDDLMKVFDINPGADGLLLTADDTRTSFSPLTVSNHDPEGLTFFYDTLAPTDATKWALFMVNGVDSEVHRIPALTNAGGQFTGWNLANSTHFDVFSQGVQDPEGIVFDRQQGLYVVGKPQTRMIHVYTNGALIRTVNLSAFNDPDGPGPLPGAGPRKPAGLAFAPASNPLTDPNGNANNVYISSRGVDNNADPNEDDGAVYEVSLPPLGAYPPAVAAGPDLTVFSSNVFQLNGAVANAGSVTWTQVPNVNCAGTLTWGPYGNNAAVTTANFDAAAEGICVLRLSAVNDPNVYDDVAITVRQPSAGFGTVYVSPLLSTKVYAKPDTPNDPNNTLISVANEDIIAFDTATRTWSIVFKGKMVGLGATGVNVDAFKIMTDGSILLSLDVPVTLPISDPSVGTVVSTLIDDSDIVRFVPTSLGANTAGSFELYFDGSDVGLDTDSEDIDAIGFLPSGKLVVSLTGSGSVPGVSTVQDEDLIAFTASGLGVDTSGTWAMHFDGSDVEMADGGDAEDLLGVWIDSNNAVNPDSSDIYLSTKGAFTVTGAIGDGADILKCSPSSIGTTTACLYSVSWDGGANGIETGAVIDGIDLLPDTSVGIDTTPPTVNLTAPAGGATVVGTISVSADASDNLGVVGVQFKLDGANLGIEDATAPYTLSWNSTTVANGVHSLTAVARDAAGNTTTSAPAVSVTVANGDLIPPTVNLTAPAGGATATGTVTVAATAADNVGVAGVQFKLDGANLGAEDTTSPYSISWNTTTATAGAHSLTAVARDANGNTTTSAPPVSVTVSNSLATLTFAPTADAGIRFATPANNYGTSTSIGTRSNASSTGEDFLMKFTVSGIGTRSVVSAKLRLHNKDASDKGGDFYRVADNTWTETGVTWNNAPVADPTALASLGTVALNTWYEVNVKPLITGDGVVSLRVQSTSTNWAGYSSKEDITTGFVPQLVITVQ